MFGIEALDGSRKQAAKTRGKKGRLDRGLSDNGNSADNPPLGAAVKALSGLRMRAKLRALAKKKASGQ